MTTYAVEVTTTTRPNDTRHRETHHAEGFAIAQARAWVCDDTPLVTIARFETDAMSFCSVTWHPRHGVQVSAWRTNDHRPLGVTAPAAVA